MIPAWIRLAPTMLPTAIMTKMILIFLICLLVMFGQGSGLQLIIANIILTNSLIY